MLAFLGGTGPEGRGLALRYALAGREVFIGSREPERGSETAHGLEEKWPGSVVRGGGNEEAARLGEVVFICVPYAAQKSMLAEVTDSLAGKVVVNVVAPLALGKAGRGELLRSQCRRGRRRSSRRCCFRARKLWRPSRI